MSTTHPRHLDVFEQQMKYRSSVFVARHPALRRYIANALIGLEDEFRGPGKYRFMILIEPENIAQGEGTDQSQEEKQGWSQASESTAGSSSSLRTEMQFTTERFIVDIDYRLSSLQQQELRALLAQRIQSMNQHPSVRKRIDTTPSDDVTLCAALELAGARDPAEHTRPYRLETGTSRAAFAKKSICGLSAVDRTTLEKGFGRMLVRALTLDSQLMPAGGGPPPSVDNTGLVFYLLMLSNQPSPPDESVREATKPIERRWVDAASARVLVQGDLGLSGSHDDSLLKRGGMVLDDEDDEDSAKVVKHRNVLPEPAARLAESLRIIPLADVQTEILSISFAVEENVALKKRLQALGR